MILWYVSVGGGTTNVKSKPTPLGSTSCFHVHSLLSRCVWSSYLLSVVIKDYLSYFMPPVSSLLLRNVTTAHAHISIASFLSR